MIIKTIIGRNLRIFRSYKDYFEALMKPGCCTPEIPFTPIEVQLLGNGAVEPCIEGLGINYLTYTEMDLTPYGGDVVPIASDADIIAAFAALGITVTVDGLENCPRITITGGYTGVETTVQLLPIYPALSFLGDIRPVCTDGLIDFVNYNTIDLTPFGGGLVTVANETDIVDAFGLLGYGILIVNCNVYIVSGDPLGQTTLQFSLV